MSAFGYVCYINPEEFKNRVHGLSIYHLGFFNQFLVLVQRVQWVFEVYRFKGIGVCGTIGHLALQTSKDIEQFTISKTHHLVFFSQFWVLVQMVYWVFKVYEFVRGTIGDLALQSSKVIGKFRITKTLRFDHLHKFPNSQTRIPTTWEDSLTKTLINCFGFHIFGCLFWVLRLCNRMLEDICGIIDFGV